MPVRIVGGNLFDSSADILVNAVNCDGVMGAGIARTFAMSYPEYLADYKKKCAMSDICVGEVDMYHDDTRDQIICSFPTMRRPGEDAEASWILVGLESLRWKLSEMLEGSPYRVLDVAIPALGCGIGGLDFKVLIPLVEIALGDLTNVNVFLYAPLA